MNPEAWEAAFALMADHGQAGACGIVSTGMEKADKLEVHRGWEAIANCLNAVAYSSLTKH